MSASKLNSPLRHGFQCNNSSVAMWHFRISFICFDIKINHCLRFMKSTSIVLMPNLGYSRCRTVFFSVRSINMKHCVLVCDIKQSLQRPRRTPGFRIPRTVLGETTDFGGSTQQRSLQVWPSWLIAICSFKIGTSSGGNCKCSSHCFYLEGRLKVVSSGWVPEFPTHYRHNSMKF